MEETTICATEEKEKKKPLFGRLAFLALLIGIGSLAFVGISAWRIYAKSGPVNVGLLINFLSLSAIFCGIAFVLSVTTLFLRHQKKGLAITTLVLSLVFILIAGGARYAYYSVFESFNHDEEFNEIPDEELYITPKGQEQEIKFENFPTETLAKEEIEDLIAQYEVDWPLLEEADVPDHVYPYMYSQEQESPCYLLPGAEEIENFILYGIDENGLSDVIMIVSMDRAHKKIKLISIQRDSYVRVPGWGGYTKINHAYGIDKETSAIATLNLNFKLNIKDYFTVHFSQMKSIIDVLGGVDVYLDSAELNYMRDYTLHEGMNHLNGQQALKYSRMRAIDSEVTRTGRQREVLNSLFYAAKSAPISTYPDLVETFTNLCKTSVDGERILSMMIEAVSDGYTLENYALINYVKCWGGQFGKGGHWYFVYDLDAAGDTLYRLIYEDLYVSGYPNNKLDSEAGY